MVGPGCVMGVLTAARGETAAVSREKKINQLPNRGVYLEGSPSHTTMTSDGRDPGPDDFRRSTPEDRAMR